MLQIPVETTTAIEQASTDGSGWTIAFCLFVMFIQIVVFEAGRRVGIMQAEHAASEKEGE